MRRQHTILAGVVVLALLVNVSVYFFLYLPAQQNGDEIIREVESVPAFTAVVERTPEPPEDAHLQQETRAGERATYAWSIVNQQGGEIISLTDRAADEYLVVRLEPTEVTAAVTRRRGATDYDDVIRYRPTVYDAQYFLMAEAHGFTEHTLLPVISTDGAKASLRMLSPREQDNTTPNLIFDYAAAGGQSEAYIVSINASRAQDVAERLEALGASRGEEHVAGGIPGFVSAHERFFSLQAS